MRIGQGYDVHRIVSGRKLVIGGVAIPFGEFGLLGHSDADVLTHAVMDALLGAAGMGDIGRMFPDTDPALAGISSMILLSETGKALRSNGYRIINIDATVVAQAPKLMPYISQMQHNISLHLETDPDSVNIKATTEEGLGFTGTGEGMAAYAVALIEKVN